MPVRLPRRMQEWYPPAHGAGERRGVEPLFGLAVLDKETTCGLSKALDKQGPGGTGDKGPRHWIRYAKRPNAGEVLKRFTVAGVEFCLPADGRGFGRGGYQHDLMGDGSLFDGISQTDWCLSKLADGRYCWEDMVLNTDRAFAILRVCLEAFDGDKRLAACAYNAGIDATHHALLGVTSPATTEKRYAAADRATTGKNYGADVWGRFEMLRERMSIAFPGDDTQ